MADLQASQAEIEDAVYPADSAIAEETKDASTTTGTTTKATEGSEVKREASLEKAPSHDLGKAWKTDLAEKEKLLNECKNQIRVYRNCMSLELVNILWCNLSELPFILHVNEILEYQRHYSENESWYGEAL